MKTATISILAAATVVLGANAAVAESKVKACFVYPSPIGDFGWSYQHHTGALEMQKTVGEDKVEVAHLESVPDGADAERAIERLARSGCSVIFGASFGYTDPMNQLAARFPDVKFEIATGYKREHPNVSTYNSRFYEGYYVEGVAAAASSQSGSAGFVAAFPLPEVLMAINAFALGAQTVNPDFSVTVVWTNSFFDPSKEADAAKALIDQGSDVITQYTNSTAPLQVASERKVKGFGLASDMRQFGPEVQLTAIVHDWAPYYTRRVNALLDGSWQQQHVWGGMEQGHIVMAPYANMSEQAEKLAKEAAAKISAGGFNPFSGPIKKQDGSIWLKEGEKADDGALFGMNFFVAGVNGAVPR